MGKVSNMAEQGADIPSMDYAEHERTYEGFVALTKFTILAILVTLVGILIIAFTDSVFFKFVGFALIFAAYLVGFAEFKLKGSGVASFSLLVITLLTLVVAIT